ncbi:MAG: hypothetical protein ACYDCL_02670 [Myxococcales bacterium]
MNRFHGILLSLSFLFLACGNGTAGDGCNPPCLGGWICVGGSCSPVGDLSLGDGGLSMPGGPDGGPCFPDCAGLTAGAFDAGGDAGVSGAGGGTARSCDPVANCQNQCRGASDGCGGSCSTDGCAGCCSGTRCLSGQAVSDCGGGGVSCESCSTGGECVPGDAGVFACCYPLIPPTCRAKPFDDGCGRQYEANCAGSGVCYQGSCCTPSCDSKCPGAGDGCGGVCPALDGGSPECKVGNEVGCCNGAVCESGDANSACGTGGSCQSCQGSASCNVVGGDGGRECCTPGAGCGPSCGDPNMKDDCGNACPWNCLGGCCNADDQCVPGTADAECGTLGDTCSDCGSTSCAGGVCGTCHDGDTKSLPCNGQCGTLPAVCTDGVWVPTAGGFCEDACAAGGGCCVGSGTPQAYCTDGYANTTCGLGGSCSNCTSLGEKTGDLGFGICGDKGNCCYAHGAPVPYGSINGSCCSGTAWWCNALYWCCD